MAKDRRVVQLGSGPRPTSPLAEWVAGVDEVGRGCLFGPVVAAAVVLPETALPGLLSAGLTDSKKLRPRQRQRLALQIRQEAIAAALGLASVAEIDRLNILQASLLAMERAVAKLSPQPSRCLIDGNQPLPRLALPQRCLVGGDRLEPAIAAASILAKVWRDELLERMALHYPGYDLAQNKGYGTAKHLSGLHRHGPSAQHRRSFAPCQGS